MHALFEKKNQKARARLLRALLEMAGQNEKDMAILSWELAKEQYGITMPVVRALEEKGIVKLERMRIYRDPLDRTSLISELTIPEAKEFLKSGNVGGGMLPKLQNCIQAIESGVSRVHILDGRIEHCLLLEFFTNKGIGTAIIGDGEEPFFNEQ